MGGPIAQLVWHRHRERTAGLVLCATAHRFRGLEPVRDLGPSLAAAPAGHGRPRRRRPRIDGGLRALGRPASWRSPIAAGPCRPACRSPASTPRAWIGEVDVPHAVVVTTRDAAIVPARQRRLVAALPAPSVHEAAIDHTGCVTRPAIFVPALLNAIDAVQS